MELLYFTQLPLHIKAVFICKATVDSTVTAASYHFNHFIARGVLIYTHNKDLDSQGNWVIHPARFYIVQISVSSVMLTVFIMFP